MDDKPISAFAFNIGREIEQFIIDTNNNQVWENKMTEAKVLDLYARMRETATKTAEYSNRVAKVYTLVADDIKRTFNISEATHGRL